METCSVNAGKTNFEREVLKIHIKHCSPRIQHAGNRNASNQNEEAASKIPAADKLLLYGSSFCGSLNKRIPESRAEAAKTKVKPSK